jgi:hypothetical protein
MHPGPWGLYPHEILMLYYAPGYRSMSQSGQRAATGSLFQPRCGAGNATRGCRPLRWPASVAVSRS